MPLSASLPDDLKCARIPSACRLPASSPGIRGMTTVTGGGQCKASGAGPIRSPPTRCSTLGFGRESALPSSPWPTVSHERPIAPAKEMDTARSDLSSLLGMNGAGTETQPALVRTAPRGAVPSLHSGHACLPFAGSVHRDLFSRAADARGFSHGPRSQPACISGDAGRDGARIMPSNIATARPVISQGLDGSPTGPALRPLWARPRTKKRSAHAALAG
jgi:hypothetical protein